MSGKQSKRMRQFWAQIPPDEKKEILSEMGRSSVKIRLGKLTPEQRSEMMKKVRLARTLKDKLKKQKEQYEFNEGIKNSN